jgi:hypothetical protein
MDQYPNLIHAIPVKLRIAQKSTTKFDPDTGDPIGKVRRSVDKTVNGQPCWKNESYTVTIDGKKIEADGYIMFRRIDLATAGFTIDTEDQVITIGSGAAAKSVNYYIVAIQLRAHYPEFGGHCFLKAHWSEKKPTRHQ